MKKLFFVTLAVFMAACGSKPTGGPQDGGIEGGMYHNGFFGFSMDVPEGMHVADRAKLDSMSQGIGSVMGMDGADDDGEKRSGVLFLISANELGTVDSVFNCNITAVWERLPKALRAFSSEKYLSMAIKMLESAGATGLSPEKTELSGRTFLKVSMPLRDGSAAQDTYVYLKDGYVLIIVGSYSGDGQKKAVGDIISTVRFDRE